MSRRDKNILFILFAAEVFLVCLYFHYQPKCIPCAIEPCPPCISHEQKVIRVMFFFPVAFAILLIVYKKLNHKKVH
jgi:hypothetical protein